MRSLLVRVSRGAYTRCMYAGDAVGRPAGAKSIVAAEAPHRAVSIVQVGLEEGSVHCTSPAFS